MGNWLENLIHKLEEQERQKQADAEIRARQLAEEKAKKDVELARVQEEFSRQKERIRQQLRSILVKYDVPSMLTDVKSTVWGNNGRIIEESDASKVAIGLVYGYKKKYRIDYSSTNFQDSGTVYKQVSPWFQTRLILDGVIIRVELLRDKPKIYFKSGILVDDPDNTVTDYHRDKMKKEFMGDHKDGPQSQLIIGQNDSEIISNLHLALATDSLRRQKYDDLPKQGLFSDKKSISI